jgi:hypothetical protein
MAFNNLPGVMIHTVDGGLAARRVPRSKSTLVIGTSAQGPVDPYQVVDRADAALAFGLSGNLVRAMEEVATYSDNLILYRMGTKPMVLTAVGKEYAAAKTISNVVVATNVATITTTAPHGYVAGDTVKVAAVTNTTVNGDFVVLSAPTTTTFTYAVTAVNASAVDTGSTYLRLTAGINIEFGERVASAQTDYKIWYKDGVLAIWKSGELVFSNDSGLGSVDTGDITVSDSATLASQLGLFLGTTNTSATLANSITVQGAAALTGTTLEPLPTLTQPTTGVGLTGRQTYVALAQALDLLQLFKVDQVVCPAALVDHPNVAFYVASDASTAGNNPVTNADALDWIKVTTNSVGNKTWQWANDTVDSEGATVAAMGVVADAAARQAAGFYEANFPHLLAVFCQKQGETLGGCVTFIATNGPVSYRLSNTRDWVGYLPTYNPTSGVPTAAGKGLLGIPMLVGTTATKLNPLCADFATGYRLPGIFQTTNDQYDGSPVLDKNQNKVDIGAFVHVVADRAGMSNAFKANYEGPIVGMVAGFCSNMDEKSNLTNKALKVIQLWKPAQSQLDALTFAKINVLRFKDLNTSPNLLHGFTAATKFSDYTNLLRVRIKFLVVKVLFDEAEKFIGESVIDGLQLSAMKTALEARMIQLQKRGYISFADFAISATAAEQRLGTANIEVSFTPADELVRLNAFVGIVRR